VLTIGLSDTVAIVLATKVVFPVVAKFVVERTLLTEEVMSFGTVDTIVDITELTELNVAVAVGGVLTAVVPMEVVVVGRDSPTVFTVVGSEIRSVRVDC